MENATKALLIAGGALLMILTFSVMNYIFNQMGQNASNIYAELEESDITEFNQKFLNYDGKSGLTIQDVVSVANIARNNTTIGDIPTTVKVFVDWIDNPSDVSDSTTLTKFTMEKLNEILEEKLYTDYTYSCKVSYGTGSSSNLVATVNFTEEN